MNRMTGEFETEVALDLPHVRIERVSQLACGPFHRVYRIDRPLLIFVPPAAREPAHGWFGWPGGRCALMAFGPAVLVPAGVSIHIQSPGFSDRRLLVLRFEPDGLYRLGELTKLGNWDALPGICDLHGRGVLDTLDRMTRELDGKEVGRDAILSGLALVLEGEINRYLVSRTEQSRVTHGELSDWQMRRINASLADETLPPPRVAELAQACGIGSRHLMRAFKARTGQTVMEWVERATFDRAIRMLAETDASIKEISATLGYVHPASFTTAFSRHFGVPPRDWRKRRSGAGQRN